LWCSWRSPRARSYITVTICDHQPESRCFACSSCAISLCASFSAPSLSNSANHCFQSLPVAFLTASSDTAGFLLSAMAPRASELEYGHLRELVVLRGLLARQVGVDLQPRQLALDTVVDLRHCGGGIVEAADGDVNA